MSIGIWQIILILIIVFLIFGPKRLSALGKSLGEAIKGLRKAVNDDEEKTETKTEVDEDKKD